MPKQNTGKVLEELVKMSAKEQGWDITRFRDAGFMRQEKSEHKRFTTRNICDFVMFKSGKIFYVECKACAERLDFKRLTQHKAMKQKHAEGVADVHVGYLLKVKDDFFYVPFFDMDMLMTGEAKSVSHASLGHYKIDKVLPKRKKKYRIDLSSLLSGGSYD